MVTFPDYDYGLFGGTDSATANADPNTVESIGSNKPAPQFTIGVVYDDVSEKLSKAGKEIANIVSSAYWKLILGVAIIGIVALVILGASGRFMRTVEGG